MGRAARVRPGAAGEVGDLDKAPARVAVHGRWITVQCSRRPRRATRLSVQIESRRHGELAFDATLALRRHALTRRSAARLALRYPLANVRVLALIYGHAVGLSLPALPCTASESGTA